MTQPMKFDLPNDQWAPAEAPAGTDVVIMRRGEYTQFRPNITVTRAGITPEATLEAVADYNIGDLREVAQDVTLARRQEVGSPEAPGLVQLVDMMVQVDDERFALQRLEHLLVLADVDSDRRVVVSLALTAQNEDMPGLAEDFQALLDSVRFSDD